jgi:hypothetical protein
VISAQLGVSGRLLHRFLQYILEEESLVYPLGLGLVLLGYQSVDLGFVLVPPPLLVPLCSAGVCTSVLVPALVSTMVYLWEVRDVSQIKGSLV